MKNIVFLISLLFLTNLNAFECENSGSLFGSYSPPFAPIEITIQENSIEVSASGEIVTRYGTFGLGYSKNFETIDNDCYYIVINNLSTKDKIVYAINRGDKLKYKADTSSQGLKNFTATSNMMEFDITKKDNFKIVIKKGKNKKNVQIKKEPAFKIENGNLVIGDASKIQVHEDVFSLRTWVRKGLSIINEND